MNANNGSLPDGWIFVPVHSLCAVNPAKPLRYALAADADVTFVPMPAVDAGAGAIARSDVRPFASVRKGYAAFAENDVVVAKITPCMENGKAALARGLANGIGFGSTEFHVLRAHRAVLPDYIYRFVRQESFRRDAEMVMTGSVGQKRVPADFIKDASILCKRGTAWDRPSYTGTKTLIDDSANKGFRSSIRFHCSATVQAAVAAPPSQDPV